MTHNFALTRAVVLTLTVGMFAGAVLRAIQLGALEWLIPHATGLVFSSVHYARSLRELFLKPERAA